MTQPGSLSKVRPAAIRGRGTKTAELAHAVLEVFAGFDGTMSTRQVYYQLVSRGEVENRPAEYERVQRLLVVMRRDGEIPYNRVVDRTRGKHQRAAWGGVTSIMNAVATQYRRDLWEEQDTVVMVACEKQALEGIFAEVADEWGASLWTLRGYASVSFMFEWATEIRRLNREGVEVAVAYFGDFDPSGLGIEQDSQEKLRSHGAEFTWTREGLLETDFEDFDLVNVPVKPTDSRSKKYLDRYGDRAAELDALRPDELRRRIAGSVRRYIDAEPWDRLKRVEQVEKESLRLVTDNWNEAIRAARAVGG